MNKIAFITGATSGIGKASAHIFAKNHYNLIITGRRKERLDEFANHLTDKYAVEVLALNFDVRNRVEVEVAVRSLSSNWKSIDVLLNNAGLAVGLTNIQDGVYDDWERMIDTNIKGLLYVTRNVAPLMISQGKGHIINIGSIAGKETYSFGNVYCGTKHAVDSLTKAMRIDMVSEGIRVTQVAPGAVETEFSNVRFKGDNAKADSIYKGFEPLQAEDIADAVYYCANLPAHVNINDMVIMPTAQANATTIIRK
ncbi:MAG: SDR family NAD(P)-dependent oxidoreductase [Bacteroidales bacterium]|nr:SDR family NAD(P)-dependent oxidoreductase [Bacteroidales bacterium]